MLKQPNYPEVAESDKYYIILANRLAKLITNSRLLINEPEQVRKDVILAAVGYFQDVVADAGVWRSFCTVCKEYYGTPLPLYPIPDDYIESELNEVDLRFVIWYVIEMSRDEQGTLSPFDPAMPLCRWSCKWLSMSISTTKARPSASTTSPTGFSGTAGSFVLPRASLCAVQLSKPDASSRKILAKTTPVSSLPNLTAM